MPRVKSSASDAPAAPPVRVIPPARRPLPRRTPGAAPAAGQLPAARGPAAAPPGRQALRPLPRGRPVGPRPLAGPLPRPAGRAARRRAGGVAPPPPAPPPAPAGRLAPPLPRLRRAGRRADAAAGRPALLGLRALATVPLGELAPAVSGGLPRLRRRPVLVAQPAQRLLPRLRPPVVPHRNANLSTLTFGAVTDRRPAHTAQGSDKMQHFFGPTAMPPRPRCWPSWPEVAGVANIGHQKKRTRPTL
jgi:hypothetical protein